MNRFVAPVFDLHCLGHYTEMKIKLAVSFGFDLSSLEGRLSAKDLRAFQATTSDCFDYPCAVSAGFVVFNLGQLA